MSGFLYAGFGPWPTPGAFYAPQVGCQSRPRAGHLFDAVFQPVVSDLDFGIIDGRFTPGFQAVHTVDQFHTFPGKGPVNGHFDTLRGSVDKQFDLRRVGEDRNGLGPVTRRSHRFSAI